MPAKKTLAPHETASTTAPATKVSPARQVAFQLLRELATASHAHSDDLLQGAKIGKLAQQDRNLCTALVMGVLRWQMVLDVEIAGFLTHKTKLDEPVRTALRMGAFQLVFLDRIPAHAAISDSVELTKRAGHRFASGMVNAVLRKMVPQAEVIRSGLRDEAAHPAWLVERWQATLGERAAKAVCTYDQQQPQSSFHLATPEAESRLIEEGVALEPGEFLHAARRLSSGVVGSSVVLKEGAARVQDEGSQLVAELLGGTALEPKTILDCCAAPGGKTAILAERYPAARVMAWDVSEKRLAQMKERFAAQPQLQRIEYEVGDATLMPVADLFDLILCDVPCSGTGTLARNPEIKQRLLPEDLLRQQERQVAILTAALRQLAPGGRLLYSTCSLEPEENEAVVERVLDDAQDVQLLPIDMRIRELQTEGVVHEQGGAHLLEHAVRKNYLRTIPGISSCDGFFAALLTRG